MKPIAITFVVALAFSAFSAGAEITAAQRTDVKAAKFSSARIIFNGDVTANKALELTEALQKFNLNYPQLKNITIYINSYGGDMDGGYIAAQAIKSSAVPVTTVNMAMTASAATLLYCAGSARLVMPLATFGLHPAATMNSNRQYVKPDELTLLKQLTDKYNGLFKSAYKTCTNLNDDELKTVLYSESARLLLDAGQAIARKMADGVTDKLESADISLTITDTNNQ